MSARIRGCTGTFLSPPPPHVNSADPLDLNSIKVPGESQISGGASGDGAVGAEGVAEFGDGQRQSNVSTGGCASDGYGNGGFGGSSSGAVELGQTEVSESNGMSGAIKATGPKEDKMTGAMSELQIAKRKEPLWTRGRGAGPPEDAAAATKRPRVFLVSQVRFRAFVVDGLQQREEGVVAARMADDDVDCCWPELVWVPASLVQAERRLEMSDSLRVSKFKWESTGHGWAKEGGWMHNGALNFQATALEVDDLRQERLVDEVGLVTDVHRHPFKDGKKAFKTATVAAPLLPCAMKIQNRHLPAVFDDRAVRVPMVLALHLLPIKRPSRVFLAPGHVLPDSFPCRTGEEMLTAKAFTVFSAQPHPDRFVFPFTGDMTNEQVRHGERVLAAAVAAQVEQARKEQRSGTLVVTPSGLQVRGEGRLAMSFRWRVETKKELVTLGDIWEEDTAVSCVVELGEPIPKPCAQGFITEAVPRAVEHGFELYVRVILGPQQGAKEPQRRQYEELRNGEWDRVQLKPLRSVRSLSDRMRLLTSGGCSSLALDVGRPAGRVMALLLGRPVEAVPPQDGMV